jgi:hypothetical protein
MMAQAAIRTLPALSTDEKPDLPGRLSVSEENNFRKKEAILNDNYKTPNLVPQKDSI